MEITSIDKAGRLIIPAQIRKKLHLDADSKLVIVTIGNKILLEKLDLSEIAQRLQDELKNIDVETIATTIREEMNERARNEKSEILA
jgi:AbrB family looped-hinge helix DNA binding protein